LRIEGFENAEGPDMKLKVYGDWAYDTELASCREGCKEVPLRRDMNLQFPMNGRNG
jgi:hypothetical protein